MVVKFGSLHALNSVLHLWKMDNYIIVNKEDKDNLTIDYDINRQYILKEMGYEDNV